MRNAKQGNDLKPFWVMNWAQLSTNLWKTCLQRTLQVFLHASRNCRSLFTARGWSEWIMQLNIFAVLWFLTLCKSHTSFGERIISFWRAETNHDKVASPNNSQANEASIHIAHNLHKLLRIMHLSRSSRRAGGVGARQGIGQDFDIFQKIAVKLATPGQKCEVKYN